MSDYVAETWCKTHGGLCLGLSRDCEMTYPRYEEALARTRAWHAFAPHTEEERAAHAADLAIVDAHENRPGGKYDLPGADPMGDE